MSEIRRGALLSYSTILLVNLSGLLLTPFIIRSLGNSEYGLYLLIGSLAAYLGVLDFGLNNAVTRYVAQCAAKSEREQEARFLGAALVVNALAAVAIIGLGTIFYANIDAWFGNALDAGQREQARIMLLLLIATVVLTVTSGMFTAICAGHERFTFPKTVNLVRYLLRIGLVLAVLHSGGGAITLVAMDMILSLFVFMANFFYAMRSIGSRFNLRSLNIQIVRSVLAFSAWVFVFAVIGQLQWHSGQIVVGKTIGMEAVAIYGVGVMFGTYYGAFSTAITGLFLPRATYMTVENASPQELGAEMARIGRMALLILLLILGGFASFGHEFLQLWAGPAYGAAWKVALMIMFAYTVPLVQSFANQLLEAKALFAFKAKVYLVALPLGVLLGYFLLELLGVLGMALGIASGWVVAVVVMNFYYHLALGLDIPKFFFTLSKGIAPAFVTCLVVAGILRILPGTGWPVLLAKMATFAFAYSALMYRIGLNDGERHEVKVMIERLKWTHA
ncbi:lipopolysaccharide biosynthesis protein [Halomonas alimentaria]|uniref:lipopolysaccharide biosynthesis protein n=1 Tax=Halomonas alimentaria TaxID=147248 RepID=UPI002491E33B|nr:oligosaccharide flippase family protein [Halomonas alimentaria]